VDDEELCAMAIGQFLAAVACECVETYDEAQRHSLRDITQGVTLTTRRDRLHALRAAAGAAIDAIDKFTGKLN